jgi:hypothetical protein
VTDNPDHVAGAMVRRAFDEIRTREATITIICPFVADHLTRTTAYSDLLDAQYPGYSDRAAAESARADDEQSHAEHVSGR